MKNNAGDEARRQKAKNRRYKKAMVKGLNYYEITQKLWDIQEACSDVHWYTDTDDDSLVNALNGDEDEAYEFRMMFADLEAETEQMLEDVQQEYIPACFDDFFAGIGAGSTMGGLLGYDEYEQDYFGFDCQDWGQSESAKRMMRMTKQEILDAAGVCFNLAMNYLSLLNRYENLKDSLDILRGENTGYLQVVKKIDELYEKAAEHNFYEWHPEVKEFNNLVNQMPQEAFL